MRSGRKVSERSADVRLDVLKAISSSNLVRASARARNPRWEPGMGMIPDPRQIGDSDGDGDATAPCEGSKRYFSSVRGFEAIFQLRARVRSDISAPCDMSEGLLRD
jgi:hypothetical protein